MDIPKMVQLDFGFECEPVAAEKKARKPFKIRTADFVFDFMDCMASPIIVFESAWKDTIPVDMLAKVKLSRLLASIQKEETATLTEALVFMMPRTFESPMPTEWVNIYTWLGLQYAKQFHNEEQLKGMLEIAPQELTDHENGLGVVTFTRT